LVRGLRRLALLENEADIFERGSKKSPDIDEGTFRTLHAKIARLTRERQAFERGGNAVANDFSPEGSSLGLASEAWDD
jgi:hypothetical protein